MSRIVTAILLCQSLLSCSSNQFIYAGRYIFWNTPGIEDYKKFPYRTIENAPPPFHIKDNKEAQERYSGQLKTIEYGEGKEQKTVQLDEFLRVNGTSAFIIIRNDAILYEKYFNGLNRSSIVTSFSLTKSVLSSLVGIAIEEGYIKSIDEPVINYIPELRKKDFRDLTIRRLLTMSSGIKYSDGILPWDEKPKSYFWPDLRHLALNVTPGEVPGKHFNYNEYNPLLLGLILERATGRSVAAYLREKIWQPLGMEYPASWSIDSREDGFEKMGTGLNARPIDFAKFGLLYLHKGNWNGKQIVPEHWVLESTSTDTENHPEAYYPDKELWTLFFNKGGYYKFLWWGYRKNPGYDFFAMGSRGQFIYICPDEALVLVRFGEKSGRVDWWPAVLRNLALKLN
jgi:CubicO group peptidase (beta-lactamase class C family)